MDKFNRGDILTLDDNTKYVVVDFFEMENKHYLYLINADDKRTTSVVEVDNDEIVEIDNQEELNKAYKVLIERNKDEINEYLKEFNEN